MIVYDCPDQYVYGASCWMNCSSGDPLTGSNRVTCDKVNKAMDLDWKIDGNAFPYCNRNSIYHHFKLVCSISCIGVIVCLFNCEFRRSACPSGFSMCWSV